MFKKVWGEVFRYANQHGRFNINIQKLKAVKEGQKAKDANNGNKFKGV